MKQIFRIVKSAGRLVAVWTCLVIPSLAQTAPPVRIMPLGDSITQGCCSGTGTEGGYRNRLYYLLANQGFNVDFVGGLSDLNNPVLPDRDHEGHPGARINDLRQNIASWLSGIEDPDVILLNIGTNDFFNGLSPQEAHDRLRNLLADLSGLRPHAKIIVSSLLPRTDTVEMMQLHEDFNQALPTIVSEQVALGRQVSFADIHAAVPADYLTPDGVHPTLAGYDRMADGWLPAIQQVITPLGTSDPPQIAAVTARMDLEHVAVKFSKPIKDADVVPSNFFLNGGVPVLQASLDAATKRIVTLVTGIQTPGIIYDLAVSGIRDRTLAQNVIAPGTVRKFTSLTVTDGSFEQNGLQWTGAGNLSIYAPQTPRASDGTTLVVFNDGQRSPNGVVSQTVPTVPGQKYLLRFDMGVYAFNKKTQALSLSIMNHSGGQVLLSRTEALAGLGGSSGSTRWVGKQLEFTAIGGGTTLVFQDVSSETDSIDLLLDNVRLEGLVTRTLAVQASPPSALNVMVTPADMNTDADGITDFTRYYDDLAVVTLNAPHLSPGGDAFQKWQKNGVDHSLNSGTTVTMDGDHVMTALYVPNTAPVAADDSYAGYVETPIRVSAPGLLANDSDANLAELTAVLAAGPSNGSLALNPNGSFTYTPNAAFVGTDSFTYQVSDGGLLSNTATVTLTVSAAPPGVPVNGSFELGSPSDLGTLYGWSGSGNRKGLMATATYPSTDGGRIAVFNLGNDVFDSVIYQSFSTIPGQLYTLELDMGIVGVAGRKQRLQVTVSGANTLVSAVEEATSQSGVAQWHPKGYSFIADSTLTTLTLGDASGSLSAAERQSVDTLLDNIRISESSPLALTVSSSPISAVAVALSQPDINGQSGGVTDFTRSYGEGTVVTLTAPSVAGGGRFEKWLKNGLDLTTNRSTVVMIDGNHSYTAVYTPNTPPVANGDTYVTVEDATLTIAAPGVLANDTDADGNTLSAVLESGPVHGGIVLNPNGGFTYTPVSGYEGPDSFSYRASDGVSNSGVATVSITVNPLGPFVNGNFEDGLPVNYGPFDGWSAAGDALGFLAAPPNYATLPGNGVRFACFNNGDNDFSGVLSQRFATIPGATYKLEYDLGITGVSGKKQALLVTVSGNSPVPLLSAGKQITSTGGPTFWADPASTTHTFVADSSAATLVFSDDSEILSSIQSQFADMLLDNVRVTLLDPGNDAPVAVADGGTVNEGGTIVIDLAANDTDADDGLDLTSVVIVSGPSNGSLVNHGDGTVSYTHDGSETTADSFTYTIEDLSGAVSNVATASVTITPVNDAPVAVADGGTVNEGGTIVIDLAANDTDADDGLDLTSVVIVSGPSNGSLVNHGDGTVSYTHDGSETTADSFTYTIEDLSGAVSNVATVTITVSPAPVGDFSDWLAENGLPADPTVDSDQDGTANIIEYIIGGDPVEHNDSDLLPSVQLVTADPDQDSISSEYVLFTYRRTDRAAADPTLEIKVEWSSNLTVPWIKADGTEGVETRVDDDAADEDVDLVRVYIPRSLESNGRLFVRLGGAFTAPE